MTVNELKILVEKKRCGRERIKRHKTEDGAEIITVVKTEDIDGQSSSALRSSWLQRKSKNTEVDVRIIDDEVTVKLVQQKRVNCLIFLSKVLDELQLDLHHVAGGLIGDYYSFLFNSKHPLNQRCERFADHRIAHVQHQWCGYLYNNFVKYVTI